MDSIEGVFIPVELIAISNAILIMCRLVLYECAYKLYALLLEICRHILIYPSCNSPCDLLIPLYTWWMDSKCTFSMGKVP